MSVLSFVIDDKFFLRTWKSDALSESDPWTNVYEFRAVTDGGYDDLVLLGERAIASEAALHLESVRFTYYEIGTWNADSVPYDPSAFLSHEVPAGTFGHRTQPNAASQLPLSACLSVRRSARSGRMGKIYYRGVLTENDVERQGAGWGLTDPAGLQTELEAALDNQLGKYVNQLGVPLVMSMIGKNLADTVHTRVVESLDVRGVANVQMKHAWYNRTPAA